MKRSEQSDLLAQTVNVVFGEAYLALLEADKVSLSDELQQELREKVVPEVWALLRAEQEGGDQGSSGGSVTKGMRKKAEMEVNKRLNELLQDQEQPSGMPLHLAVFPISAMERA